MAPVGNENKEVIQEAKGRIYVWNSKDSNTRINFCSSQNHHDISKKAIMMSGFNYKHFNLRLGALFINSISGSSLVLPPYAQ